MNDMSAVIIPRSDQLNADSFIAGPQTFTISDVQIRGGQEQPVSIALEGTELVFRPCKSMSRVLVHAWGPDANAYRGRSLTLYRDPDVKWGGLAVGGIRISHMTHIDGKLQLQLTATKGQRKPHIVLPLVIEQRTEAKPEITAEEWTRRYIARLDAAPDADALEALAAKSKPNVLRLIPDLAAQCLDALDARHADFALIAGGGRDVSEMGEGFTDGSDQ